MAQSRTIYEEELTTEELKTIPKELRLIFLNDALGRVTFNKEEVMWLFNRVCLTKLTQFSIFHRFDKEAIIWKYEQMTKLLPTSDSELTVIEWINVKYCDEKVRYNWGIRCFGVTKESLCNELVGRLDTVTFQSKSNESPDVITGTLCSSDMILLDIESVFQIMCHRYESINELNYKRLAVNATKQILNNIVNYYGLLNSTKDEEKLSPLVIYLIASAELLGLSKYRERGHQMQFSKRFTCSRLYKMIDEALGAKCENK